MQSGTVPGITVDEVDKFLKQGVNRLLSMQVGSGGFAYWPGQLNASWWGSMYAISALTLAREAGFDVCGLAAIFSYGFDIATENFKNAKCAFFTLSNYNALIKYAEEHQYVLPGDVEILKQWRENPETWGQ